MLRPRNYMNRAWRLEDTRFYPADVAGGRYSMHKFKLSIAAVKCANEFEAESLTPPARPSLSVLNLVIILLDKRFLPCGRKPYARRSAYLLSTLSFLETTPSRSNARLRDKRSAPISVDSKLLTLAKCQHIKGPLSTIMHCAPSHETRLLCTEDAHFHRSLC